MSIHTFAKAARNLRNRVQINANFYRGREFVPNHANRLFIETSSVCNLKCRFCAYEKKQSAKVTMEDEFFIDCVEQAVDMGLCRYHLTPCTGDVFMDKSLFNKLDYLEAHERVDDYDFYTNFTIPTKEDLERLGRLKKLMSVKISIYGHDLESFIAITKSTEKVYRRLIENLESLLGQLDSFGPRVTIGLRATRDVPWDDPSDLLKLLVRFKQAGVRIDTSRVYSNWGGYITQDDVKGLGIDVTDFSSTYKKGACTLLFTGVQVMATGIVNGCACRDVDATLRIGDMNEAPLKSILSTGNEAYMQLIREQQEGNFRPVCRSCDFYKSIYRITRVHRKRGGLRTLKDFMAGSYVPEAVEHSV